MNPRRLCALFGSWYGAKPKAPAAAKVTSLSEYLKGGS